MLTRESLGSRPVVAWRGSRTNVARLVEAYERSEWPRAAPTLPVLLAYIMDQHGLSRADLVPLLGTASRVSEVPAASGDPSASVTSRTSSVNTFAECGWERAFW